MITRPHEHLAFYEHAKAVLKPAKMRKNQFRIGRFKLKIDYSRWHGAEITICDPTAAVSDIWREAPNFTKLFGSVQSMGAMIDREMTKRLSTWRLYLESTRHELTFREHALMCALLAFQLPKS